MTTTYEQVVETVLSLFEDELVDKEVPCSVIKGRNPGQPCGNPAVYDLIITCEEGLTRTVHRCDPCHEKALALSEPRCAPHDDRHVTRLIVANRRPGR